MVLVIKNFLGNHRAPNYRELVTNMLMSFKRLKVNMTTKIHMMHQHIDFFKDNLGKISDEHGERFHQQIKKIEERFLGKRVENMLAEFVWYIFEEYDENLRYESQRSLRDNRLRFLN